LSERLTRAVLESLPRWLQLTRLLPRTSPTGYTRGQLSAASAWRVDITFRGEDDLQSNACPARYAVQLPQLRGPAAAALYRECPARGGAVNSGVLRRVRNAGLFKRPGDRRLLDRSGGVCTNMSRCVYRLAVTALSVFSSGILIQ